MPRGWLVGIAAAVAVVLALLAPASASALSCAAPLDGYSAFRSADLVAEGVLLSGPSRDGVLFSPARLAVSRYLKGSGAPVLRVGTLGRQIDTGAIFPGFSSLIPGLYHARAGETWRVYGFTSKRNRRASDGGVALLGAACNFDDVRIPASRVLRPVSGAVRRTRGDRRRAWRAAVFAGPRGVRCVRLARRPGRLAPHGECGRLSGRRATLVGLGRRRVRGRATTAVAVAGRGLRRIAVIRPADGATVTAGAKRGLALAVLDGVSELSELDVVARYADGSSRRFGWTAQRAVAAPTAGRPAWAADFEPGRLPRGDRTVCVTLTQAGRPGRTDTGPAGARSGECARRPDRPFLAVRRVLESTEATRSGVTPVETLVFGAVPRSVTHIAVRGPEGERAPALSRRGRAFVVAYAGSVPLSQLAVSFSFASGAQRAFVARRSVNVARLPAAGF